MHVYSISHALFIYLTTILPHALLSFSFYTFLMVFFFYYLIFLKVLPFSYVCSIVFKAFLKKIFFKKN